MRQDQGFSFFFFLFYFFFFCFGGRLACLLGCRRCEHWQGLSRLTWNIWRISGALSLQDGAITTRPACLVVRGLAGPEQAHLEDLAHLGSAALAGWGTNLRLDPAIRMPQLGILAGSPQTL